MKLRQLKIVRWAGIGAGLFMLLMISMANVQAASTSQISSTISFTLTDIQVGGVSAIEFADYEAEFPVESFSSFDETFLFGGTGFTSGSSSSSQNGSTIDPMDGGDLMLTGDTLALTLNSSATANTGHVNRDQSEFVGFSYNNYTDDGAGETEILSFLFDYTVSYTTSLSNDVAGDQAFVGFDTFVTVFDDNGETIISLFPESTMDQLIEFSFAAGTVTPGDMRNGSFALDLFGGNGSFEFEAIARTPTNINVVPVPAAVWLFGSGLGLLGWMRRRD